MDVRLKIGISACVLGQKVRFDKGHKALHFCTKELSEFADFTPVCPEVGVGLPIPRPTIRQINQGDVITVSRADGTGDVTQALTEFGQTFAANHHEELSGFIFCAKSPSCGMERVKVYHKNGKGSESNGVGLFAKQVIEANPDLPCEENGRLNDPILRENFMTRAYTYQKWLNLKKTGLTKHKLITFHSEHKYLVMSHHVESYKSLGQLLAQPDVEVEELAKQYISGLMEALSHHATRKSHTNTLQHLQGYFKKHLDTAKKQQLAEEIHSFREGITPLLVPIALINHYLQEFPNEYLASQTYLNPHPKQLRLRYGY
jgi:uncharacterized protein YbgA (DUF1722 family)/uncharacterized protein YbbK (DUF523 family)